MVMGSESFGCEGVGLEFFLGKVWGWSFFPWGGVGRCGVGEFCVGRFGVESFGWEGVGLESFVWEGVGLERFGWEGVGLERFGWEGGIGDSRGNFGLAARTPPPPHFVAQRLLQLLAPLPYRYLI